MKVRKIFISVSIGLIFMATGAALILMRFGQPPVRSILIAAAFFVLCFIPVAGTCRSLRQKEGDGGSEFRKGKLAVIRPFVLFVLSPLLCGLIGFLTYPSAFTGPLILIVMVGASLFYFMYGNVSDKKVVTKK
jgi:ABC-type transport system involved in multi-copper enzyme maturation permease subunit